MTQSHARRNNRTLALLLGLAGGMVGLAYASVPMYRLFCQVTGFGGVPKVEVGAAAPGEVVGGPSLRIQFNADTSPDLPWTFAPEQREVRIKPGQEMLIAYHARNNSDHPITGTAVFNVTPPQAGSYFVKTQCFCFEKQTLNPGQDLSFPVLFYVDPSIKDDAEAADIREITLSYTFYPSQAVPLEQKAQ